MCQFGEGGFPWPLTFQPSILTAQPPTTASAFNLPGLPTPGNPPTTLGQCNVNIRDGNTYSRVSTEDSPVLQTHPWDAARLLGQAGRAESELLSEGVGKIEKHDCV